MNISALKSGASAPFAALFGRAPAQSAKRAEDDGDKKKDDENENDSKSKAEGDEPEKKKDEDEASKKKGEGDDDDKECEDDDENDEKKAEARGRDAERSRWSTVLASKEAVGRGESACMLLSTTDLDAAQITRVLAAIKTDAKGAGLAARMGDTKIPNPGTEAGKDADPADPKSMAQKMIAVYDRAVGRKKS